MCCPVVFRHVLSCKILFFARWETIESFCLSFRHTCRQMCFYQKPDRRPPQITGGRVSTVHQGGIGAPNELATFRVHDAVVDFVERSVWRTRNCAASNPRSAWEILRSILAEIAARNRFFPEFWKVSKKNLPNWVHRRPFRQSLAGIVGNFILLAFHFHRSDVPIVSGSRA